MATYIPPIVGLCLWAGLFFAPWGGGEDMAARAVASLIVALIPWMPAAFVAGLVWRYVEFIGDAASRLRDRRRYRRAPQVALRAAPRAPGGAGPPPIGSRGPGIVRAREG